MSHAKTVVLNCAGVGARLGYGHTKSLLQFGGKPIILHHLEQLKNIEDVRIVVGFGAQDVINTVLPFRKDITFVFNHKYLETDTLTSLSLGSTYANDYIISLDGDLLVRPEDLQTFLNESGDVIGITKTYTDQPVCILTETRKDNRIATKFERKHHDYEWTGLVQIHRDKLIKSSGHVYQMLKEHLPIRTIEINCHEIDTPADLERAVKWFDKHFFI